MRRDRFAGDHAALVERGEQPPLCADHVADAFEVDVGFQAAERCEVEPLRDGRTLPIVGDDVEAISVANLVEPGGCRAGRGAGRRAFLAVCSTWGRLATR